MRCLVNFRNAILGFLCLTHSAGLVAKPNPSDPRWQQFVAGHIRDIPNASLRSFIIDSQHNNPYAAYIQDELKVMGPFAPGQDHVFWLPTLEVPLVEANWRFVSRIDDAPAHLRKLAIVNRNGRSFLRMILHPYSTQEKTFQDMAAKYGGFKYEFQAVTTASVRSLIIWKASKPWQEGVEQGVDFPKHLNQLFHGKVSLYGVDINGSRLNPAKKMARAETVTRLMNEIPQTEKRRVGFDFSGEWIVAVPDGTDAGFVYRELLSEYASDQTQKVMPGYSVLSPAYLNKITKGLKNPLDKIMKSVFKPVARTTAYLLFEEMMLGEMHSQNYGFVVDSGGKLTGKIVLHDADAFRVSLKGRVLNEKSVAATQGLDNPFFYLKDSVFSSTQSSGSEAMTLNSLMDYLLDPNDPTSMPGTIWEWCVTLTPKPKWCTEKQLRQRFLQEMAELVSPYLGRSVKATELDFLGTDRGSVGVIALFKERLSWLSRKFVAMEYEEVNQEKIRGHFEMLISEGRARTYGQLDPRKHVYRVIQGQQETLIMVHDRNDPSVVRGVGILNPESEGKSQSFLRSIGFKSSCGTLRGQARRAKSPFGLWPLMRRMGGGNNVGSIRSFLEHIFATANFSKNIFVSSVAHAD